MEDRDRRTAAILGERYSFPTGFRAHGMDT